MMESNARTPFTSNANGPHALPVPAGYSQLRRPHVSEWFGHRIFPVVSATDQAIEDQRAQRCPFLSDTLAVSTNCVKQENSKGVCTISALSNGMRQDWLVCPYRALDRELLDRMIRRLYRIDSSTPIIVQPAVRLARADTREEIIASVTSTDPTRVFVYLQDKLGGEIRLSRTSASPEVSFDITVVEITDTHGSYRQAVEALRSALDLHSSDFSFQLAAHPEWAGRRIEGPNISNVFKRTFYQIAFKFQVTKRDTSVGCLLAVPQPVWDSWQPFLGAPTLTKQEDGTWRLLDDDTREPADWIFSL